MRRRVVVSGVLVGALVASGGAVAGLSAATAGKIASGVRVGPVELGGLTASEAKERLRREYLEPLQRPVVVERRGKQFSLSASEARVTADLDQAVAAATKASESTNAMDAAWRTLTGSHVDQAIRVPVAVSDAAVLRFVDRVRRGIDRAPKDAVLSFEKDRPVVSASHVGMAVDRQKLRRLVAEAAVTPTKTPIIAPVDRQEPKVSESSIKVKYETVITVDRGTHLLRLFKDFKLEKRYRVAVGMQGLETPAGTYTINDKQVDPAWHVPNSAWAGSLAGTVVPPGPSNPIKARWMGFFDGAGIHGTSDDNSIGSAASHGCVRMHVSDVIDLYPRVPVGTTINVV